MASIEKRRAPNRRLSSYMSSEADGHRDEDDHDYSDIHIPHLFRLRGSVIPNVIYQTLVVTAFSAAVTAVYMKTDIKPAIPQTFIPVLGFVVGLLLTYRTNTAYDRYWEGRRTWSSMVTAIRNLTRHIWVGVKRKKTEREVKEEKQSIKMKYLKDKGLKIEQNKPKTEEEIMKEEEKLLIKAEEEEIETEKKSVIRFLIGFAFAVKHYLREEEGNKCEDVTPFISGIKSSLPGFRNLKEQDAAEKDEVQNKDWVCWLFKIDKKLHQRESRTNRTNHNLPLEISLYISDYISTQFRKDRISVPISNNLLMNVNTLIDCLSSFERILRSPIPLAYSIHLTQTVWIYCLSLPFQMVSLVGWPTIVIVFFATFILLGIERIAAEIENPFGYDPNDLKMGDFCRIIERELKIIISHPPPDIDHWVFDEKNIVTLQKKDSYIDSLYPNVKSENEITLEVKSENEIAIDDKVDDKVGKVSR